MAKIFNKVFPIYNADGTPFHNLVLRKATYESSVMSLGDKITGDVVYKDNSLEFTMGEYISFKSNFGDTQDEEVKFFLVNPPTVTREGVVSNSSDLKGATKYSLEFYHPMYMLSNFPFSDVAVSSDEKQYLSENKTFSWIGNPIDFFAKLNKNLQGTEWVVIKGSRFPQEKETELSEVLSFDKNTIADALKTCYDTWGVPFVVDSIKQGEYTYIDTHNNEVDYYDEGKRFVVLFGLPSSEIYASVEDKESGTPYIFKMGQGLGLKNNSRTPKNNKIITRIAGYGSERNVPYGYPQIVWYGNQDWDYTIDNDPNNPHSYPIYKGIVGGMYVKLIKHPFTRSHLMPSIYGNTVFNKVSPYLEGNIEDVVNTITYSQWYEKANGMVEKATEEGKEGWELDLLTNLRDVTCPYTPESAETLPSAAIPTGLHTYTTDQGEATINVQESNNIVTIEVDSYWYNFTYKVVQIHKTLGEENPDYDPDLDIVDYYDAVWSQEYPYENEINPLSPSYEAHEFEDIYPRLGEEQIVAVLPYEQEESVDYVDVATATSKLEEQKVLVRNRLWAHQDEAVYYTNEIQAIIDLIGNADVNEEKEVAVYKKMWFTNKSTQVDIITWKITSDGYFNYVTFSSGVISFEMKILFAVAPPAPTWDDTMDDDGNYKQSYFKLTLPQLDFDVYACASITEEMQINMRSGACIGCTFTVQVDWDDYKKNFYDSEGRFLPHGEQRNLEKYPDSSTGNITLIVQKDLETFGTIMPNIYQQPQTGDDFVILGISLPKSYITNAEEELDDASKSYMLENNVYYFEYPLKFDEKFLTDNDYILSQIRNNAIVRFLYYDTELELFVSQLSVKYGESPLPQYSITLTDNIEVVLNQIGQVTEDVEHVSSLLALLRQTYSNSVWSELADKVSKTYDNVLQGVATFLKGIKIGTLFGITEQGDATLNDVTANSIHHPEGKWNIDGDGGANFQDISSNKLNTNEISTQRLTANEAHFFNLIIDEVKSVGGQIVVSPANAEIIKVVETNDSYVCYFKAEDQNGNGIDNQFATNDLALHMEFNVSDNGTRNYWRKVVSVVSNTNTDVDGVNILCHAVRLSKSDCKTNSAAPQVGDRIVVFGNTTAPSRQNAIVISAYNIPFVDDLPFMGDANGILAPLFVEYSGVGGFNITDGMRRNVIAKNGTRLTGDFMVYNSFAGGYTKVESLIQALGDSITLRVSSVENTVANGMKNLILNSDFTLWDGGIPVMFTAVNNTQPGSTTFEQITSNLPVGFQAGVIVSCLYGYDGIAMGTWSSPKQPYFPIEAGKSYTFSFWVKTQSNSYIYIEADKVYSTIPTSTTWERKSLTFTAKDDNFENNRVTILCQGIDTMYLTGLQLEEGGNMTAWKPAVEDTNANIASQVDIKADEINGTITNLNNGLEIAGVHVDATTPNNSEIRLRANKVKIQTYTEDSGATDTLFTTVEEEVEEGGQIVTKHRAMVKTDYVQATEVVTNGLQAQTIDADNATIENLNVRHAEIEESVFKGDIYTPPFILDEDNIGEKDEEDPSKYKYLTKISKLVYYYEAGNRNPKSKTIIVYAVKVGVIGYNVQQIAYYFMKEGGTVDVDYVVINEPSTTSEKEALCGVECNYVYTPRTNHNINMVVLIWNEEAVAYQNTEITLQPMSAVKCKYTKYRKPTDGTFDYGWVLVSHSNCLIPFNQQANILTIDGCLVHKGGIVNKVRRTQSMTIRLTTEDSFLFTTGNYNKTIYLPDNPAMGQTIHIRICGSHSITVYPATSASYGHKISNNGVNKLDDWSTNDGGICIFVWDGVDSWQLARMENTGT